MNSEQALKYLTNKQLEMVKKTGNEYQAELATALIEMLRMCSPVQITTILGEALSGSIPQLFGETPSDERIR